MIWHPIETAPKDGTWVILGNAGEVLPGRYEGDGWFIYREWKDWETSLSHPTHWMHLPECPCVSFPIKKWEDVEKAIKHGMKAEISILNAKDEIESWKPISLDDIQWLVRFGYDLSRVRVTSPAT